MSKQYLNKYDKISQILNQKNPIIGIESKIDEDSVVIGDLDGWIKNPEHRWIYNKMNLCQFQDMPHAPMPIPPSPEQYPVILKPMINLYGMGLNSYKVNNQDELYDKHWHSNHFWMPFLTGQHYSYDLFILDGEIKWKCGFRGYSTDSNQPSVFDYWESIPTSTPDTTSDKTPNSDELILPPIVIRLIEERFSDYTGCLNLECIGDKIIEAHLRMGDIDQFPKEETQVILSQVIQLYQNHSCSQSISNLPLTQIYLLPIWSEYPRNPNSLISIKRMEKYCQNSKIISYQIDNESLSHPPGKHRLFSLTCTDLKVGLNVRKRIQRYLKRKNDKLYDLINPTESDKN